MNSRESAALTVLIEDFKARWQHFLNLDNEVNRWTASYAIGLVVSISWILNSQRFDNLNDLFTARNSNNSYFLLSLALVNALYILSLAFKGYQIQQICLYLCVQVGKEIEDITGAPFNSWEIWRRTYFNQPEQEGRVEWRRRLYYPIVTFLPFVVSATLLGLYFKYVARQVGWFDVHNLYFYFVLLINLTAAVLAMSTMGLNKDWEKLVQSRRLIKPETPRYHEEKATLLPQVVNGTPDAATSVENPAILAEAGDQLESS